MRDRLELTNYQASWPNARIEVEISEQENLDADFRLFEQFLKWRKTKK